MRIYGEGYKGPARLSAPTVYHCKTCNDVEVSLVELTGEHLLTICSDTSEDKECTGLIKPLADPNGALVAAFKRGGKQAVLELLRSQDGR